MKNKILTLDERKEIEKLCKLGFSASQIANKLDRSKTGIIQDIRKNGGKLQYNALKAEQRHKDSLESRKQKLTKPLSEQEQQQVKDLLAVGDGRNSISKKLGICRHRIDKYLKSNKIYPIEESNKKMSMMQRIEKMEKQVKLLTDYLKRLNNV